MATRIVIPDAHIPYHDKRAFELVTRVIEKVKPDEVIVIGDFADFYSVSQFSKDPERVLNLKWEVDQVNKALDLVKCKNVVFLEGNHEYRLSRYIQNNAPALAGITSVPKLFNIEERGWSFVPYGDFYRSNRVTYVHDLGFAGKYSMFSTLQASGGNVVYGHSHQAGIIYQGHQGSQGHFCMNVGWLGDYKKLEYMNKMKAIRQWRLGFGLVEEVGNLVYAQFIPVLNYQCHLMGKTVK